MSPTSHSQLEQLAASYEVLTTAQLKGAGLHDSDISTLVEEGRLARIRRGIYRHAESPISEHHDLIQVISNAPKAVVVLLSALRHHNIGTQQTYEVWIQLPAQAWVPGIEWPPIRVIRTRVLALQTEGVEVHTIGSAKIPVTTPARTVADCFKFRNQIGLDVCVEALRETIRERKASITEIEEMGKLIRVEKVMRPYIESMI